jgi:hypothetical protein
MAPGAMAVPRAASAASIFTIAGIEIVSAASTAPIGSAASEIEVD